VLNISELATMWHLPIGENPDQLRQGLYQRFVPVPSTVNEPGSVQIGQAVKGGQAIPVALSSLAVRHNTLILGKTQKGKTTVAGVLAQSIMAQRDHALVVTLAPAPQVQVSRPTATLPTGCSAWCRRAAPRTWSTLTWAARTAASG
jgi:hypothetical protein